MAPTQETAHWLMREITQILSLAWTVESHSHLKLVHVHLGAAEALLCCHVLVCRLSEKIKRWLHEYLAAHGDLSVEKTMSCLWVPVFAVFSFFFFVLFFPRAFLSEHFKQISLSFNYLQSKDTGEGLLKVLLAWLHVMHFYLKRCGTPMEAVFWLFFALYWKLLLMAWGNQRKSSNQMFNRDS